MTTKREQELRFVCEQLGDIIHYIWDFIPEDRRPELDKEIKLLEEVVDRVDLTKEIK